MELESEGGWKIPIENESKVELGRGTNFSTDDRTVSRRHILLQVQNYPKEGIPERENAVCFQVTGKNPVWFCSGSGGQKRAFRNSEKGELRVGDRLSISLKRPVFFCLKKGIYGKEEEQPEEEGVLRALERRKKRTLERKLEDEKEVSSEDQEAFREDSGDEKDGLSDLEIGSLDISRLDPVKEFGFLPPGQEFKQYLEQRTCEIKDWDWFLEESNKNSEDDEMPDDEISRMRTRRRGKAKKHDGNNDEDWTGESEDEKVLVTKLRSTKRPKYSNTRSNELKHNKDALSGHSTATKTKGIGKYANNEDDETLGGFIVDDEEEEEQEDDINDEEEEFEDNDNDDDE